MVAKLRDACLGSPIYARQRGRERPAVATLGGRAVKGCEMSCGLRAPRGVSVPAAAVSLFCATGAQMWAILGLVRCVCASVALLALSTR